MKVRIFSSIRFLAERLASEMVDRGIGTVEYHDVPVFQFELRYRADLPEGELERLRKVLRPLAPELRPAPADADADAVLLLGDRAPLSRWQLRVRADSRDLGERITRALARLHLGRQSERWGFVLRSTLDFGGAPPVVRQAVRWLCAREGLELPEHKAWQDKDEDVWVCLRDPAHGCLPPRAYFAVQVACDDPEAGGRLLKRLRQAGFRNVELQPLEDADRAARIFSIDPGPFVPWRSEGSTDLAADQTKLERTVAGFLARNGVDLESFPIRNVPGAGHLRARVSLPLARFRTGELRPWAGPSPRRFDAVVRTDDETGARELVARLRALGFGEVLVVPLDDPAGFRLDVRPARELPVLVADVRRTVEDAMAGIGAAPAFALQMTEEKPDEGEAEESTEGRAPCIVIDFSVRGVADGSLREAIRTAWRRLCPNFDVKVHAVRRGAVEPLLTELQEMGFREVVFAEGPVLGPALIKYGGAPAAVVEQVADAVERTTGTRPSPDKEWVSSDDDVWIYVPVAAAAAAATRADSGASDGAVRPPDLTAWLGAGPAAAPPVGSLLSVESERLRVGEIVLPRCTGARSPLAPDPAAFAHYCLDGITAETLVHVATSVLLREPCLLEGETSTSKTSSILFLASLLGLPVVRLNLNGQTDTGELVGRFLPQSLASGLPIPEEELFEDRDLLESETRMILGRAREERRMLTKLEVQQVMANEQMRAHPWRWQDGLVVQAMRKGWWVLLDEVNLAEPQILERLNSVLEPIPSLVLTEHDNSVLGPGGTPVHPGFRIFATMNPAEYEGRSTLSPAYRDRWRAYRFVPPPGEAEYYQMLRRLVFGEQPAVMVLGRPYLGTAQDAPYSALAGLPGIVPFLEALARFHVGLESGVRQRDGSSLRLGVRRREPYVFSRRGLLSLIEFLARRPFGVQDSAERVERTALARYYLARVADPEDQEVVVQLLDAVGLGPKQSAVVPAPPGAAAPPAPPGPGGARVELPKAPPASTPAATLARASAGFKLVLLRLSRDAKKIDLVKALRRRTALSLRDAKELVDTPGSVLMTAGTEEEARRLRRDLRKFGAHLRILASGES